MSYETPDGPLNLYRVSLMATVELAAYSREEAIVTALEAVAKAPKELLRPFYCSAPLSEIEPGTEAQEEKGEEKPEEGELAGAGSRAQQMLEETGAGHGGVEFSPSSALKEKWIKELTEKITEEVSRRMESEPKPVPIPIK